MFGTESGESADKVARKAGCRSLVDGMARAGRVRLLGAVQRPVRAGPG